jgi:Ca2+-binding RTX toxin-like protein
LQDLARMEGLEHRTLMSSVELTPEGVLAISGTDFADSVRVREKRGVVTVEDLRRGRRDPLRKQSFFAEDITTITFDGGAGKDAFDARGVTLPVEANGGAGNDKLYGGNAGSTLLGEDGRDTLVGGDGNDSLSGGASNDSLLGGEGDDDLTGDEGVDVMKAGDGNDTLHAADGEADRLVDGGDGQDAASYDPADSRKVRRIEASLDDDESDDDTDDE